MVGVRQALRTALDVVLGVASGAFCVKRRAAVRLDCALKFQPAGRALDTFLAANAAIATTAAAPIPQGNDLLIRRARGGGGTGRCGTAVPDTRYARIGREMFLRACSPMS